MHLKNLWKNFDNALKAVKIHHFYWVSAVEAMVVLAEELQEILATLTIVIIMVVALLKQVAAQVELKLVLH